MASESTERARGARIARKIEQEAAALAQDRRKFLIGLARAFGGAIIFAFPLLMTMEMWWLGFYMDRLRLALFVALDMPVLLGLSYYAGFCQTFRLIEDALDALTAFAVGVLASATMLALFGILGPGMPLDEVLGKVALQAVPASIGAILASKQFGDEDEEEEERLERASYGGEMFLTAVGALFVAFNVAPTEEMILIAYKMSAWHAVALAAGSLLMMHALVYTVGFGGQESTRGALWTVFLRFTVVGYAIALVVSLYVLWTFGRIDDTSAAQVITTTVVLGFPAALGAALARLIL